MSDLSRALSLRGGFCQFSVLLICSLCHLQLLVVYLLLINTHAYTAHITFSSKVLHCRYHPLTSRTEHNPISCCPSIPSSLSLFPFPSLSTPPCDNPLSPSSALLSPSASSTICSLLPFLLAGNSTVSLV